MVICMVDLRTVVAGSCEFHISARVAGTNFTKVLVEYENKKLLEKKNKSRCFLLHCPFFEFLFLIYPILKLNSQNTPFFSIYSPNGWTSSWRMYLSNIDSANDWTSLVEIIGPCVDSANEWSSWWDTKKLNFNNYHHQY